MRNQRVVQFILCTVSVFTLLYTAGCGNPEVISKTNVKQHTDSNATDKPKLGDASGKLEVSGNKSDMPSASPSDSVAAPTSSSSSGNLKSADSVTTIEKPDPKSLPYHITSPFSANNPTLMGLSLGSSKSAVTSTFGVPRLQYTMDDPRDPIVVCEYWGFNVGYNAVNNIQFIEVNSSEVNPGLNGLGIGQNASDAIKALGPPSSNSSFVLSYMYHNTILKLDVDPATQQIHSIKLFPAE